jgi:hypothetical protein
MRYIDILNNKYGSLTVIDFAGKTCYGRALWKCLCSCNNIRIVSGKDLRNHKIFSCKSCAVQRRVDNFIRGNTYHYGRPYQWIYSILSSSAKATHRKCLISYEDFLEYTKTDTCHYCGDKIPWSPHQTPKSTGAYFLDRKNNSEGYTKENCAVCCSICNRVKSGEFSYEEMLSLGETIREIKQFRNSRIT